MTWGRFSPKRRFRELGLCGSSRVPGPGLVPAVCLRGFLWRLTPKGWRRDRGSTCPLPTRGSRRPTTQRAGSPPVRPLCQEAPVHSRPRTEPQSPALPPCPVLTCTLAVPSFCSPPSASFQARNDQRWPIQSLKHASRWIFPEQQHKRSNMCVTETFLRSFSCSFKHATSAPMRNGTQP